MRALPLQMFMNLCLPCALVGQTPAPTPTPKPALRKVVKVDAQMKVIEETSLNLESPLQAIGKSMPDISAYNSSSTKPQSGNGMTANVLVRSMGDMQEEVPTAMTFYEFVLEPKEELSVKLKAKEGGGIYMRFVNPIKPGPMTGPVRRANLPHKALRMQRIQISNPNAEPAEVTLALLGLQNIPYRMDIERKR